MTPVQLANWSLYFATMMGMKCHPGHKHSSVELYNQVENAAFMADAMLRQYKLRENIRWQFSPESDSEQAL